jgi:hypothetical protein
MLSEKGAPGREPGAEANRHDRSGIYIRSRPDSQITLILHPHVEGEGYHLDRFDAYLNDQLIVTSRQPLYDGCPGAARPRLRSRGDDDNPPRRQGL